MEGSSHPSRPEVHAARYTRKRQSIAALKGFGMALAVLPVIERATLASIPRFASSLTHGIFVLALIVEVLLLTAPVVASVLMADWLRYRLNVDCGISAQTPWFCGYRHAEALRPWPGNLPSSDSADRRFLCFACSLVVGGEGIGLAALWTAYIYLFPRIHTLAARAQVSIEQVFTLKISEKLNVSNLAVAGIAKRRRLILTDTIMRECSFPELEALLAHQLGQVRHHDGQAHCSIGNPEFISCWVATFPLAFFHASLRDVGSLPLCVVPQFLPYSLGVLNRFAHPATEAASAGPKLHLFCGGVYQHSCCWHLVCGQHRIGAAQKRVPSAQSQI